MSISITCVQGLTQTPQPILQVDDGANLVFESFGSSAAQAVSTTCVYTCARSSTALRAPHSGLDAANQPGAAG